MLSRSDKFDATVIEGGTAAARLDVLEEDLVIASLPAVSESDPVGIADGQVTIDVSAPARRTHSVTIADSTGEWVPMAPRDLLSVVSGHEVKLWRGWKYPGVDEPELLPQGVFDIDEPSVADNGAALSLTLTGSDRSRSIRDNLWTKAYVVRKGQQIVAAAKAIILNRRPSTQFRGLDGSPHETPFLTYDEQADPWAAAQQVLAAGGLEAFFDEDGFCVIQAIPDPQLIDPAWWYHEDESSQVVSMRGSVSRDDIYNGVIAVGENTYGISPARAEVWDTDPASPTYAGTELMPGPFGRKPKFLSPNPAITTNAMAADAATGELRRVRRLSTAYTTSVLPHAALEGGDVVGLTRERLGVDDTFVIQRVPIPLGGRARSDVQLRKRL